MKITCFLITLIILPTVLSAQNNDTTEVPPFNSFVIQGTAYLTDSSNSFPYSDYIWSDKRSVSEIMDQRPGYFVYDYFGLGGRNAVTNNSLLPYYIGTFRDGIQVNDVVLGGFDNEIFSINEIEAIEEISATRSLLYGINSVGRSFNVITKDYFTPLPFSQLRFSQDRSNSLFADVFYSQAFSKKFGLQLGVTKHSLDGRFENSAFDTWKTRTRFNFNLSERFNIKANLYYNYINRGLNDGVIPNQSNDSLLSGNAIVYNPYAFEDNEYIYFDINLFARLFKNEESLTKINLYSQNLLREYKLDIPSLPSPSLETYSHMILYGLNALQNIPLKHKPGIESKIQLGFDIQINRDTKKRETLNIFSFKGSYEFIFKNISLTGIYRYDLADEFNFSNFGVEGKFNFNIFDNVELSLFGGGKKLEYRYIGGSPYSLSGISVIPGDRYVVEKGLSVKYYSLCFKAYSSLQSSSFNITNVNSYNLSLTYNPEWLSFTLIYERNHDDFFPKQYLKGNISYKGEFFERNLTLRSGFDFKYYNIENQILVRQKDNFFRNRETAFPRPDQFLVDFFIGARIGNANINFTVANIFNSLVYNSYIFPLDDRGGFLNAVSRFTIVWDFLN